MLQHAIFHHPQSGEGHTTDDNARALIFSVLLEQVRSPESTGKIGMERNSDSEFALPLSRRSWSMPSIRQRGRFRNFLGYDRRWNEA